MIFPNFCKKMMIFQISAKFYDFLGAKNDDFWNFSQKIIFKFFKKNICSNDFSKFQPKLMIFRGKKWWFFKFWSKLMVFQSYLCLIFTFIIFDMVSQKCCDTARPRPVSSTTKVLRDFLWHWKVYYGITWSIKKIPTSYGTHPKYGDFFEKLKSIE